MRSETVHECSKCGGQFPKWHGRCPDCGGWGTVNQTAQALTPISAAAVPAGKVVAFSSISIAKAQRITTGIEEVDRVLGGGLIAGSLILLGGEPGIGKSTLVAQIAQRISGKVLYVSGEESAPQLKDRLDRLAINATNLDFLGEVAISTIVATIVQQKPTVAIIDSIQTMYDPAFPSGAGSINQVRICTVKLLEVAKRHGITIVIVGHVTKSGEVAGPKTLEHLVDCVLYLEGDRTHGFRILRSAKNRFGSVDEVGVFEMQQQGLVEVKNPTAAFLSNIISDAAGTVIAPALEGSRIFLLEIQALVSPSHIGYPQRKSYGVDANRLQLITAVLSRRLNAKLADKDIFVNVIGGMKINEPALDLAVASAILSAASDKPISRQTVVIGEVGLTGEIRPVGQLEKRLSEAEKLGFRKAIVPITKHISAKKIAVEQVHSLKQLQQLLG